VPHLIVEVSCPGAVSRRAVFNKPEVVVGRSVGADLWLEGEHVSRLHCKLVWRSNRWRLADCDSANGVYLDRGGRGAPFLARNDPVVTGDCLYVGAWRLAIRGAGASAMTDVEAGPMEAAPLRSPARQEEITVVKNRAVMKEEMRHRMGPGPREADEKTDPAILAPGPG
jgi:predicted component of type VI protein secretion system